MFFFHETLPSKICFVFNVQTPQVGGNEGSRDAFRKARVKEGGTKICFRAHSSKEKQSTWVVSNKS